MPPLLRFSSAPRVLLVTALALGLGAALPAPRAASAAKVVGAGTAASCPEAGLAAALAPGPGAALTPPRAASAAKVVRAGTAASGAEPGLAAALVGGGTITCDCGPGPATIQITSEKLIEADTTLDGGGTVTLHGNG